MGIHHDALQEDTTTEGTGDLTLTQKDKFIPLSAAYSDTEQVPYAIENPQSGSNSQWEVGLGRWLTGGILERTTPELTWDGTTRDVSSPTALTLVGDSIVYVTNRAVNIDAPTVDSLTVNDNGDVTLSGTGQINLPAVSDSVNPTISFGAGNDGIYSPGSGSVVFATQNIINFSVGITHGLTSARTDAGGISYAASSVTTPSLKPWWIDSNTGVYGNGADDVGFALGGVSGVLYTEVSSHVLHDNEMHTGLTASTTQTQGQLPLLSSHNEITTVANDNDVVTLPTPAKGRACEVINHGANTLQLFPPSGTDLGTGTDNSIMLEPNDTIVFRGISATEWHVSSSTLIFHAVMYDQDNTTAYVINDAGADFHAYHSAGLVAGDVTGFIFDAGGAGTSFPIASIADGADSGVDIAVTTTGAHGLAVDDAISQTNLADAAYVGFFVVKAIISTTVYEVAAVYTATGTGTMDQAATLEVQEIAAGDYELKYTSSATTTVNNETFDFELCHVHTADQTVETMDGSKARRKYGTGGDFGATPGFGTHRMTSGDKFFLALSNEDSAGNITLRNVTMIATRL